MMKTTADRKIKITQANYNRMSRWYDWIEGWGESHICYQSLELLNLQGQEKILEIGSGTGTNLIKTMQRLTAGAAVGLDISWRMCQVAKAKINRRFAVEASALVNGNAICLPFSNDYFDAVFMLFTLEIIPRQHIPHTLEEIKRVLTPQGRICITSMYNKPIRSLMMTLYRWSCRTFPDVIDCQPIFLTAIIKNAGFIPTRTVERSLWGLPVQIVCASKKEFK